MRNQEQRDSQPNPPVVKVRIPKRMLNLIQWLNLVFFFIVLLVAWLSFNPNKWMAFFWHPNFIYICLGFIAVFFIHQWSSNRLSKLPIEIIDTPKRTKRPKQTRLMPSTSREMARFTFLNLLSIPFVLMVLVFTWTALGNPEHITVIYFDEFGEFWIELVIFTVIGAIVIANAFMQIKRLRYGR
jgi:hypothetical protein